METKLTDPKPFVTDEEIFKQENGVAVNSDLSRGLIFARHHRLDILYLTDSGQWVKWDDNEDRWIMANEVVLRQMAMKTAIKMQQCATSPALSDSAKKAQSSGGISSMIRMAAAVADIQAKESAFDQDPYVLNVRNGVIDLKTQLFRHRDPSDRLLLMANVNHDSSAQAPNWNAFMEAFCDGDQELMRYLQKLAGYCLTGLTKEQCVFLLYGKGSNGKSTFLQMLKMVLAEYSQTMPMETIIAKPQRGATPGIARMQGVRLVVANELNHGVKLDEALLKQLTGSEDIAARSLFKEYKEFRLQAKIFLATNNLPAIQGRDMGIWRRIKVIPCLHAFLDDERDKDFSATLIPELSGILNWCIEGALMYFREGLDEPEAVVAASEEYRVNSGGTPDVVGSFLDECCVRTEQAKVSLQILYGSFKAWCKDRNESCVSFRRFSRELIEKHGLNKNRGMKDGSTAVHGIQLRITEDSGQGNSRMKLVIAGSSHAA